MVWVASETLQLRSVRGGDGGESPGGCPVVGAVKRWTLANGPLHW